MKAKLHSLDFDVMTVVREQSLNLCNSKDYLRDLGIHRNLEGENDHIKADYAAYLIIKDKELKLAYQ